MFRVKTQITKKVQCSRVLLGYLEAVCEKYSTHEKMLKAEQYPHSKPYGIIIVGDVTVLIAVVVIMLSLVIICIFAIVARYK